MTFLANESWELENFQHLDHRRSHTYSITDVFFLAHLQVLQQGVERPAEADAKEPQVMLQAYLLHRSVCWGALKECVEQQAER